MAVSKINQQNEKEFCIKIYNDKEQFGHLITVCERNDT